MQRGLDLKPLLPASAIKVLVEGANTIPQLNHPEGICCDSEGFLWCGGEQGEIYRIDPAARTFEQVASTNGFILGLNFDRPGNLYLCDSKYKGIFRYRPKTGELTLLTTGSAEEKIVFPNYPLIDHQRNRLYVSDSYQFQVPGPGVWAVDLATGATELWCREHFNFANGLALSPDGFYLYVAESWNRCVSRISIDSDGKAGKKECFLALPDTIPDGLFMMPDGMLYITVYEPSQIYRYDTSSERAEIELVVEDPDAHAFCHPTNCVVVGDDLYVSNLGRWHISKVSLKTLHSK